MAEFLENDSYKSFIQYNKSSDRSAKWREIFSRNFSMSVDI